MIKGIVNILNLLGERFSKSIIGHNPLRVYSEYWVQCPEVKEEQGATKQFFLQASLGKVNP